MELRKTAAAAALLASTALAGCQGTKAVRIIATPAPVPANVSQATVADPNPATRMTPADGSFDVTIPAKGLDEVAGGGRSVQVTMRAMTTAELTDVERITVNASTNSGAALMTVLAIEITRQLGLAALSRDGGLRVAHATNPTLIVLKNSGGRRCSPGTVGVTQVFGDRAATLTANLSVDDAQPLQAITGSADGVSYGFGRILLAFSCPR